MSTVSFDAIYIQGGRQTDIVAFVISCPTEDVNVNLGPHVY